MEFAESHPGPATVLALSGRLDADSAAETKKRLEKFVDQGQPDLVLDLAGVDYLSGGGLRVILGLAQKVCLTEGRLVLCGLNDYLQEVFDSTRSSSFLSIASSQEEALAQF